MRFVPLLAIVLASGCYASHRVPSTGDDAIVDAGIDGSAPLLTMCPAAGDSMQIGPEPGCITRIFPTAPDVDCRGFSGNMLQLVRRGSMRWSILVRSRDESSTRICIGVVEEDCESCRDDACTMGGDLMRRGIGIGLPMDRSSVGLVVANSGGDAWLRLCSPPM